MLKIEVKNLDKIINNLNQKKSQLKPKSAELTRDLTNIAHKWVQKEAPRRTGKLKAGVSKNIKDTSGHVFISKSVSYADAVLEGTRPHQITPKYKRALYWPGASHPVTSVQHPGTKSNPFLDRAYNSMQSEIDSRLKLFVDWLTK